MLSKDAVLLLEALAANCTDDKFKIVEKSEVIAWVSKPSNTLETSFMKSIKELNATACIHLKYEDNDEICLAVTDSGRRCWDELKDINLSKAAKANIKFSPVSAPVVSVDINEIVKNSITEALCANKGVLSEEQLSAVVEATMVENEVDAAVSKIDTKAQKQRLKKIAKIKKSKAGVKNLGLKMFAANFFGTFFAGALLIGALVALRLFGVI